MMNVSRCAICDGSDIGTHCGLIAPFLAQRIWGRKTFAASLERCNDCGFEFFNPRLSDDEAQRLYADYRGPEYHKARFATEPWYTEKLNASLSSPEAMRARKEQVARALTANLPSGTVIRTILDFGGARGELIQDLIPGAEGFVYDISNVEVLPGLTPVQIGAGHRADLILCSNVFEHVASPRSLLQQVISFASPGTFLFIEVPKESPTELRSKLKRLAQAGILALTRPGTAWDVVKMRSVFVMHEHLNFFSAGSLRRLMTTLSAFGVVAEGRYAMGGNRTIWILVQLGVALREQTDKGVQ